MSFGFYRERDRVVISGSKIFLEAILLILVILALNKEGWKISHWKFLIVFTLLSLVLNLLFCMFGAWSLYVSFGRQQGLANQSLFSMVLFDILKWTVLVYFITRFALKMESTISGGGFAITKKRIPIWKTIPIGIVAGLLGILVSYGLAYVMSPSGLFEKLNQMRQSSLYLKLGFWGGFRNLVGEEVLVRLGVQTLILYYLRKKPMAFILSVILSSLYFEFWHNGFREVYFLNFSCSVVFSIVYYKFGYESAAIGHCVGDWLALCFIPYVLI
jgi:hypothetical protein